MKTLPDHRQRMLAAALTRQGYVTVFPNAQPAINTLCDVIRHLHAGLVARGATPQDIDDLITVGRDSVEPSNATNAQRANRAEETLEFYKHSLLGESGPVSLDDLQDLMTDYLHLAHREQESAAIEEFTDTARVAFQNFTSEIQPS